MSVRLSITRVDCDKTMTHCIYFDTTRNGNHSSILTPTVVGGRRLLPSEICAQIDRPPFEKRQRAIDGVRTKLIALETISRRLLLKKRKNRSLSHPFGHLGITYALRLWLIGKPVVDFIFIVIELFSLSPIRLRRYERKSAFFEGGLSL